MLHAAVVIDGAGWRACRARHLLRGPDDILIRARHAGLARRVRGERLGTRTGERPL